MDRSSASCQIADEPVGTRDVNHVVGPIEGYRRAAHRAARAVGMETCGMRDQAVIDQCTRRRACVERAFRLRVGHGHGGPSHRNATHNGDVDYESARTPHILALSDD